MGTLFKIPTLGACTTSLSSVWTTSASTLDEEPTLDCAISSLSLSTTTASITSSSDKSVTINISQHYIESLSEEQLSQLKSLVDQTLNNRREDSAPIKQKTRSPRKNTI